MPKSAASRFVAFVGPDRLAAGDLPAVAAAAHERLDADPRCEVRVFDLTTGRTLDLDLRSTVDEVVSRLERAADLDHDGGPTDAPRGRGRPRLGVVSKEVTLLPRHWAWLGAQRGSASSVLRRLVDDARHAGERSEGVRKAQDTAYRFMTTMAGDAPGYEAAIRALYRGDAAAFAAATAEWPPDVREQSMSIAAEALERP